VGILLPYAEFARGGGGSYNHWTGAAEGLRGLGGDEVGVGIEKCVDVGLVAGRGKGPAVVNLACGERVVGTWYVYGWGHEALG